ncbi:DUF4376 domain-containing protein [Pseudoalteromonas sp. T1lg65]|uniref:DUF4376 domain-containing protein n=1 Tax=Pseudoalteromonas sp. T1lg65 TaxID=2077101 RepID=UPI003F7B35BC
MEPLETQNQTPVTYADVQTKIMLRHPREQIDQVLAVAIEQEDAAHTEAYSAWQASLPEIQQAIQQAEAHNAENPEEPMDVPTISDEPVIDIALRRKLYRPVIVEIDQELTTEQCEARTEYDDEKRIAYYHPATVAHSEEHIARVKRERFKAQRAENVAAITVEVDGMEFDGDELSQQRMARAVLLLEDSETTPWILADNQTVNVTKAQLAQACRLSAQRQTELWVE